ncbi:ABC transporter permease [Lutispora saccharofermentans]|uniref:ABC-2 family transporter protein n=1 Tax=Lutispora saccharofermentans TaxID=3024236 RepID=A0ABT1NIV0_9FIRM|nr:ABC-2 family transporter protein [Lutispora saccharofermentans]MCQ1531101.1 ABC-2 family transporter protein [Lutispora saccharofermentans]
MARYCYMAYLSFKSSIAYKAEVWFGIFTSVLTLSIQIFLWKALFQYGESNVGVSFDQMITYFILSTALSLCLINSSVLDEIAKDIREGTIANYLAKPYKYKISLLSKSLGRIFFSLLFVIMPMIIISSIFFTIQAPHSLVSLLATILISICSFYIFFSIYYIAGLSTFWFMGMQGAIGLLIENILRLLSGALIPIWIFPKWLYTIASYLPVRYGFDVPISIYIGRTAGSDIVKGIAVQFIWILSLIIVDNIVWRISIRKLVIQGG